MAVWNEAKGIESRATVPKRRTRSTRLHSPVDFPVKTITPEDAVVGDIQVQSDGVLLRGHHLAVVPLHQVDASDLVPVGEQQVRAFTCSRSRWDLEPCSDGTFAFRAQLI